MHPSEVKTPETEVPQSTQSAESAESISVVDQAFAFQEATDPEIEAKQKILGTSSIKMRDTNLESARKRLEEASERNPFPELGSLSIDDPSSLEYLVQREHFEIQHPSRKTRQPTNKAAWAEPTKGRRASDELKLFRKTQVVTEKPVEEVEPKGDRVPSEEVKQEEAKVEANTESPGIPSEFEDKLDNAQRQALEEIRARRQKKKPGSSTK